MAISTSIFASALSTLALIKTYLGGDEKKNWEPIHSDEYDIDAEDWDRIVAGLSEVALRTRTGNLCSYSFSAPNVAASATDVACYRDGGGDQARTTVIAPLAGSIVGLALLVENPRTAGDLTVEVTINGTKQTLLVTINGTATQKVVASQLPNIAPFVAGDELELVYSTSELWAAGTTPSISADLLVAYGA